LQGLTSRSAWPDVMAAGGMKAIANLDVNTMYRQTAAGQAGCGGEGRAVGGKAKKR